MGANRHKAAEVLRADLVLEGGGVKGIAHVGAVAVLAEHGYRFERIAGASAGSIVGALLAAGVPVSRMERLVRDLDYRRFRDRGVLDRVPLVGPATSLLFEEGIFEGEELREWVGNLLADAGVETFADLRRGDPASSLDAAHGYALVVTVADLTLGRLVRLPWDYRRLYGLDPDRQLVADAVRASTSVPFFYEPARLRHADGAISILVDGGVLSNFPIDTFDRRDRKPPRWPTFGIKLISPMPVERARVFPLLGRVRHGPVYLLERLITTMLVGHDQAHLDKPWVRARTILVDTDRVKALDFRVGPAARELLYRNGRVAAEWFLDTWDWEDYLRRFRV